MKTRIAELIAGALLVVGGGPGLEAWGHDVTPPCWRGQAGTTYAEWRFNTDSNPASPEFVTNAYGVATATITKGGFSEGYRSSWPNSTNIGFWDMGDAGTIGCSVANQPGTAAGSYKYIWVQVAQYVGGLLPEYATVSIAGATLLSSQRQLVEPVPPFGGIYVDQTLWRIAPGPATETVTVTSAHSGGLIDQVVIDTRCVDGFSPAGTPTIAVQAECANAVFAGGASYVWDLANAAGAAGTSWDLLNVPGTGTIDVQSSSGNPFTVAVNSPAGGPASFEVRSSYDWTIATTGGGVQNFAAAKFAVNASGFQGMLADGTFSLQTATGGKDLVLHFQGAIGPLVNNVTSTRASSLSWKIRVTDLLTNATALSSHTLSLAGVAGGSYGTASMAGEHVFYAPNQPDQNLADTFTYLVKDNNNNVTNSGTVTLNVGPQQPAQAAEITVSGGQATVIFAGMPGVAYDVQRSTDVHFTTFAVVLTTNAPPCGLFIYVDASPPENSAYYRLTPH